MRLRASKCPGSVEFAARTIQRALHLLDFVIEGAAAQSEEVAAARSSKAEALEARAEHEDSFIARNILASTAVLAKGSPLK